MPTIQYAKRINVRMLDYDELKRASFNALLDDKQDVCEAVADEMSRRLKIQSGELCPFCGSSSVNCNDEYGECEKCENHWYFDDEEIYHD